MTGNYTGCLYGYGDLQPLTGRVIARCATARASKAKDPCSRTYKKAYSGADSMATFCGRLKVPAAPFLRPGSALRWFPHLLAFPVRFIDRTFHLLIEADKSHLTDKG